MRKIGIVLAAMAIGLFAGLLLAKSTTAGEVTQLTPKSIEIMQTEIKTVLAEQDAAWNRGDIDAFMQDYWKSDRLRFASGGNVNTGWQKTMDGYVSRYPDKATMGLLAFSDLEVTVLSARDALVFGRWGLKRESDNPNGLFTLHMRKFDGKWKIVSDHTSSAD